MSDPARSGREGARGRIRLSGQQARQGEIILTSRTRRMIFIGGLVAAVLVAVALRLLAG